MEEPAVFKVTVKSRVPATRAALDGSVAAVSDDVIATVGVAEETTFQFASTAFTVTVASPACRDVGEPVLPVDVPGAAVSPGSRTCSLLTVPALTVNAADVPASEPPDVRVAVTVCDDPARVNVTSCDDSTPAVNADVVVDVPDENSDVDVRSTVPVKFVTVRPPESCAVILTLNAVPAVWVPSAAPPVVVTANCDRAPYAVMAVDASDCVPLPFALIGVTLNAYVVPAVRPVTVHDVDVELDADVQVPAAAAEYAPPPADTTTE